MTEIHAIIWLVSTTVIGFITYYLGRADERKIRDFRFSALQIENAMLSVRLARFFRN